MEAEWLPLTTGNQEVTQDGTCFLEPFVGETRVVAEKPLSAALSQQWGRGLVRKSGNRSLWCLVSTAGLENTQRNHRV